MGPQFPSWCSSVLAAKRRTHSHQPPGSWHLVLTALTHTGQRVRSHRELVKKGCNKKTGQSVVIRCRAPSDKRVDQPHFTCNQPLLYPFLSVPPSFLPPPPSPANSLTSVHSSIDPPSSSSTLRFAKSGFACSFLIAH